MQVIGNVYNNPSLLDQDEKYVVTDDDFDDNFHKIVFGAIYKIHELGANRITLETISDFLSSRPKSEAVYKAQKGEEWLLTVSQNANPDSFDYYYNRLKKMSLLRAYDKYGINVTDIYDPDNILDSKKRQRQEEYLDNSTLEDIANKIDEKIDKIKLQYVDDAYETSIQAGNNIKDLIDKFKEHPEIGVPLYGPIINTVTRGARLKKFYLRSAASGTGKALPNDQIIPTPTGFRKVGDIKEGDYLFGDNGYPTKVLKVHPQNRKKRRFRIHFSDGRTIDCCRNHLWEFQLENGETKVEETAQVRERLKNKETLKVKINKPVQWRHRNTKITPYIFGLLYANAILNMDTPNDVLLYRCADYDLVLDICQMTGWRAEKVSPITYVFFDSNDGYIENNHIFDDKKIPQEHLINDLKHREALLRGFIDACALMDGDGNIKLVFSCDEVEESMKTLIYSLGFYVTKFEHSKYLQKKYDFLQGQYFLQCPRDKVPNLFRRGENTFGAGKKASQLIDDISYKSDTFKDYLVITKVQEINKAAADMTCFTVDNPSHLFLAQDFIVTHNTRSMIADACYISCGHIYDESFGWIKTGYKQPTLFISTEQELEEIQTMMLAFLSNVNEDHILNGKYEGDEEARVIRAAEILEDAPLYIELLPDFSLQDIENTIKKNIHDHDILFCCMDYIHSSIKILSEIGNKTGGMKLREDNILFMLSTRLKDLCNKYGIFIMSATQLSGDWMTSSEPNQNLLRGAKSIADKIDMGMILLAVRDDDLKALEPILSSGVFDKPNLKLSVYKNRRGRYKNIYLWCKADLGTCRIKPMFATTWNYEIVNINDLKIDIEEESAF